MSILIKDMEMPTSCPCELLGVGYDLICSFVGGVPRRVEEYYECCQNGTRPTWCPLVPVPPHGRLGDLDELCKEVNRICDEYDAGIVSEMSCLNRLLGAFQNAPTIIPAEEGE